MNNQPVKGSYRLKLKKGYIMEVNAYLKRIIIFAPRKMLETYDIPHPITQQDVDNVKNKAIELYNLQPEPAES